ncbi:MAG: 30S ribosomal protein S4 [Candidatus Nanoarchaeia archaeon]
MGDPRKIRSKYKGPAHPWKRDRLEAEKIIKKAYGLKNKTEIYRASSRLRRFTAQAKRLIRDTSPQARVEEKQLLEKLFTLALIEKEAHLEDVLSLNVNSILDRRLQTVVSKNNLALTPKQARQFIVHGHITIHGMKVDAPSYHVKRTEEFGIAFNPISTLALETHPERNKEKKQEPSTVVLKPEQEEVKKELEELKKIEAVVGEVTE